MTGHVKMMTPVKMPKKVESIQTIVGKKIREDWGEVRHFCKLHGIDMHTYNNVMRGKSKNPFVVGTLIRLKYLDSVDQLPKRNNRSASCK